MTEITVDLDEETMAIFEWHEAVDKAYPNDKALQAISKTRSERIELAMKEYDKAIVLLYLRTKLYHLTENVSGDIWTDSIENQTEFVPTPDR